MEGGREGKNPQTLVLKSLFMIIVILEEGPSGCWNGGIGSQLKKQQIARPGRRQHGPGVPYQLTVLDLQHGAWDLGGSMQ